MLQTGDLKMHSTRNMSAHLVFALSLIVLGWLAVPARAAEKRAFRMGFTPFVYDQTSEAVADMQKFLAENADIVAVHLESVPWTEALADKPFDPKMMEDWEGRKKAIGPGEKVYLAVSPINMMRAGMAEYRGAAERMPIPPEFQGKAFDDPIIKKAYLNYCKRAAEYFKPDYLSVGIEVNELFHNGRAQWSGYVELHKFVYQALKKEHPKLPVFTSFTLHNMINPGWQDRAEMLVAYKELMKYGDLVAVSFYPFMAGVATPAQVDNALAWLTANFDALHKPYAVAETGDAAEKLTFKMGAQDITIPGSPEVQATYYEKLLALAQARKFQFVITFLYRDYDALWEKIKDSSPSFFIAWRDCGLVDEKGNKRPAYLVWRKFFDMPVGR
jgi:hypothetical protein